MTRPHVDMNINLSGFATAVEKHPAVSRTETDETRSPPRVRVTLNDAEGIPDGVHDVLDRYNATIEDVTIDSGMLTVEVTVGAEWQELTTKQTNVHGNSPCFILERPFRQATGLSDSDSVTVYGREGAIKFVRTGET